MGDQNPKDLQLTFLLSKWQHADTLMYVRLTTAWAIQAFVITAAAITAGTVADKPGIGVAISVLLLFVAYVVLQLRTMTRVDRKIRNSFNPAIVSAMIQCGLLTQGEPFWDAEHWSPERDDHPMNLWHTHDPKGRGSDSRSSGIMERQLLILLVIDLLSGIALLAWASWKLGGA